MASHDFTFHLDDAEYLRFRNHPATRLYLHRRNASGDVTITSSKPERLAADLEKVIDFGATSAAQVMGLR